MSIKRLSSFLAFLSLKKQTEHLRFKQLYVMAHTGFKHFRGSSFDSSICFSMSIFWCKTISRMLLMKFKRYYLNKLLTVSISSFIFFWWYIISPKSIRVLEKHLFWILEFIWKCNVAFTTSAVLLLLAKTW